MVSVVTGLQAQTFKAYCPTKQEIECKILKDGKSVEIVKFTGRDFLGNLSVPSVVVFEGKTYKVTAIGKKALFRAGGSLHSIYIPQSITAIGKYAFYNLDSLVSIRVDKGNRVYDSRKNCNAIIKSKTNELVLGCQNTIIPKAVTSIGYGAFYHCVNLTSINIPNSVTSIGDAAFHLCNSLTDINIAEDHPIFKIQKDGETIRIIDKRTGSIVAIVP